MLAATEIDEKLLPAVYESPEVTGTVSDAGNHATGLPEGTPIVAGGGDQAAGAVGMGIVRAGTVSATIGTSGVVFAASDTTFTRSKGSGPYLLSRNAEPLACDGSDPGCGTVSTRGFGISLARVTTMAVILTNSSLKKRARFRLARTVCFGRPI
jgi:sugar (pentulose or hexulose) kinase